MIQLFIRYAFLGTLTLLASCTDSDDASKSSATLARLIAPGSECLNGGVEVDSGIDENGNGVLDADEVDNTEIICHGVDGAQGPGGTNGLNALVMQSTEAAGSHCANGGVRLEMGIDSDSNGALGVTEITTTEYVCNGDNGVSGNDGVNGTDGVAGVNGLDGANGVDGLNALVYQSIEAAGSHCANGGVRLEMGIDSDGNGVLGISEITTTEYLCNGADGVDGADGLAGTNGVDGTDGLNALVEPSVEAAGSHCANGGVRLEMGIDSDNNGVLGVAEITATEYVCNGADGTDGVAGTNGLDGTDGAEGLNALVEQSVESAGANCANGGVRVDSGIDSNNNSLLELNEILNTGYACNGDNGSNGMDGTNGYSTLVLFTAEAEGVHCELGGTRIDAGIDFNTDGALQPSEVTDTDYLCAVGEVTRPAIVGAISTSTLTVMVSFSKAMDDSIADASKYVITQDEVNTEVGTLIIKGAEFPDDGGEHYSVILHTSPQNEVTYRVKGSGLMDVDGKPLPGIIETLGGLIDTTSTTFAGAAPEVDSLSGFLDSDNDGLPDHKELYGTRIRIVSVDGEVTTQEVTSNPELKDTDADGLNDQLEWAIGSNPRSWDTDSDMLGDAQEYNGLLSSPIDQDSDNDGLFDGEEVNFFKTSPLLKDTDGDQIPDNEEVILANRNARIADLPQPAFEIESITLALDVRFDTTVEETTTKGEAKTFSTTLSQSREKTHATSHEAMVKAHAQLTVSQSLSIPADSSGSSPVPSPFPKSTTTTEVEIGAEASYTGTWSKSSVEGSQKEYNKSLTTQEEVGEGTTVARHVESARVSTLLYLEARGDVAFTISDLQITALVPDIRNPGQFLPVATLVPDNPDGNLDNSFNLGPLVDKIGPLLFTNKDVFPAQVERLQRDPTGVIFKISNYNITDEDGRNFAFSSQEVVDRTTTVVIDFGGVREGEELLGESTEFYRVATSFGRTIASVVDEIAQQQQKSTDEVRYEYGLDPDDNDSLISYDLSGKSIGVVFHDVMQGVLGLQHINLEDGPDTFDPSERLFSYATKTNINGVERIIRIRQTENNEEVSDPRQWTLLTPTGLILDAQLSFGQQDIRPNDQVLLPGSGISLGFVRDADHDGIPERLEYLHGCSDTEVDTDGDGLSDYLEVFGAPKNSDGAIINETDKWIVDVKTIGTYEGFSSCGSMDTDDDGISDFVEYGYVQDLDPDDPNADEVVEIARNRSKATDAKKVDTDDDGVSDFNEINGYVVQLSFPRITSGEDVSECVDLADDSQDSLGNNLDKVLCFTNPLNPDTDGDVLPDGSEMAFYADPTVYDAGDVYDVDGDGLLGREERDGWSVTFTANTVFDSHFRPSGSSDPYVFLDTVSGEQTVTCHPGIAGCAYILPFPLFGNEIRISAPAYEGIFPASDPVDQDTDDDGLWDDIEADISLANTGYSGATHPRAVDTDLDGRSDFEELYGFPQNPADLDPGKPFLGNNDNPVSTNPLHYDTDGDGLSDGEEANEFWEVDLLNSTAPIIKVYSDPRLEDTDNDGLNDADEKTNGTDPGNQNTDSENEIVALNDHHEVLLGLNPVDGQDLCVRVTFSSVVVHLASGGKGYFSDSSVTLDASEQLSGDLGRYFDQPLQGTEFSSGVVKPFAQEAYVILNATKTVTLNGRTLKFKKTGTADEPDFPDTSFTLRNTDFSDSTEVSLYKSSFTEIGLGDFSIGIDAKAEVITEAGLQSLLQANPDAELCKNAL